MWDAWCFGGLDQECGGGRKRKKKMSRWAGIAVGAFF
jgi:hypothetical protein